MDGRKDVLRHNPFADDDGIFKVVSVPRHKRHQHVATEGQLTVVRRRTVSKDIAFPDLVARLHGGLLVDARVLVGPEELRQLVFDTPLVFE